MIRFCRASVDESVKAYADTATNRFFAKLTERLRDFQPEIARLIHNLVLDGAEVFLDDPALAIACIPNERRVNVAVLSGSPDEEILRLILDFRVKHYAEIAPELAPAFLAAGFREVGRLRGERLHGSNFDFIVIVERLPEDVVVEAPEKEDLPEQDLQDDEGFSLPGEKIESSPLLEPTPKRKRIDVRTQEDGILIDAQEYQEAVPMRPKEK